MLDHISLNVSDFEKSKAFYRAILATLGYEPLMEFEGGVGFGRKGSGMPQFWIGAGQPVTRGGHTAFHAISREAVQRFHAAGLAAGGRDEGAPGLRPHYHPNYYAAFLWDPDGYKVEAVIHSPE
jgi:catechol 2,3-dioxygenase-like lactoylglutathione lyase family enzyme